MWVDGTGQGKWAHRGMTQIRCSGTVSFGNVENDGDAQQFRLSDLHSTESS